MYFMSGLVLFFGPWRPGSNNYYPTSVVYLVGGTFVLLLGLYFARCAASHALRLRQWIGVTT